MYNKAMMPASGKNAGWRECVSSHRTDAGVYRLASAFSAPIEPVYQLSWFSRAATKMFVPMYRTGFLARLLGRV